MRRDQEPATPTVDVVMPAHNAARWIAEALHSVVGQRDVVAWPVVVDDGSTDGTCEVVAGFGPWVALVRQSHRGIAAARNAGIARGKAPYVAFLDSDDVWEPDFLARQTEVLALRPELDVCFYTTRRDESELTDPHFTLYKTQASPHAMELGEEYRKSAQGAG